MANGKRYTAILVALVCCAAHYASNAMHSGTFYQKISDDEDIGDDTPTSMSSLFTKEFHQCSLRNWCNFVAVNTEDNTFHKVESREKLKEIGKKIQVWQKLREPAEQAKEESKTQQVSRSCKEALENGQMENETTELLINGTVIRVYCDMITDGGGWIVFQKRTNSSVNFNRDWKAYENGFGNLQGNFWLGLEALHNLTKGGNYVLRIDLQAADGDRGYAKYTNFKIGSKEEKYKMTVGQYSGNIGDALGCANGMPFATYDQDRSTVNQANCAKTLKGGWWFGHEHCYLGMLNNLYPGTALSTMQHPYPVNSDFMSWKVWKNYFGNIVFSEMKIKREN